MADKITVKTEELRNALERIVLLIKERSQADEMVGKVCYQEGRFYCKTEDTRAALEIDFLEGFPPFCVEGMDLYRYLQRLGAENVTLEKGPSLKVSAGRAKAQFALFENFDFPLPERWKKIGPGFLDTLDEVSKFVSKTYYRPVLTAVCITDNMMQATDSLLYYRKYGEAKFMGSDTTLIPGVSVPFIKLLEPDQFFIDDNIMYFRQKPTLIGACSLLSGDYPDVVKMEKDYKTGEKIVFGEATREAVARCSVFVENSRFEEDKKIYVTLKGGNALLSISAAVGGNKEKVKTQYPDTLEGISFCLRPDFFTEILTKGTEFLLCKTSLQIKSTTIWCVSALISRSK